MPRPPEPGRAAATTGGHRSAWRADVEARTANIGSGRLPDWQCPQAEPNPDDTEVTPAPDDGLMEIQAFSAEEEKQLNKPDDTEVTPAHDDGLMEIQAFSAEEEKQLNKAAFEDLRWQHAVEFLEQRNDWGPDRAHSVLVQGAKHFGILDLDIFTSRALSNHLLKEGQVTTPSEAIRRMRDGVMDIAEESAPLAGRLLAASIPSDVYEKDTSAAATMPSTLPAIAPYNTMSRRDKSRAMGRGITMSAKDVKTHFEAKNKKEGSMRKKLMQDGIEWKASLRDEGSLFKWKVLLNVLIFCIGLAYAFKVVLDMYPQAIAVFGWPVFFARMGGMMAACWTGILYWTMSRGFLSGLYRFTRGRSALVAPIDGHKDLHIMSGMALCATGVVHTVAHIIGTVPGIMKAQDASTLNEIIGCANKETTSGYMTGADFSFLQWPSCPFETVPRTIEEVLFKTVPGLTGVLLLGLLYGMYYTGRDERRKKDFDIFWYVHNVGIILWPVLLFIHGTNGWIGLGFPLVTFTAFLPIALYTWNRIGRGLRYYLFTGKAVNIIHARVRPGKGGGPDGALTYLKVNPPPCLWNFKPGMYAFICMPQYAPLQWHPFTICSGNDDPTVDFLIAGVGDWTRELARRCLEARDNNSPLPTVALDGPYMAPTQSALTKKVLVAVGAGVGITPFLSLMSTIITQLDEDGDLPGSPGSTMLNLGQGHGKFARLVEVHFYWMTRNADEFLFAKPLISRIVSHRNLLDKVFVHLHVTGKAPEKDASGYVFREALKRQSEVDRVVFKELLKDRGLPKMLGPSLPMCWVNGACEDILWTTSLALPSNKLRVETIESLMKKRISHHTEEASAILSAEAVPDISASMGMVSSDGDGFYMVPVIFGRPDFATEVRSIGKARPGYNVHLYACANDTVVQGLQDVADVCNLHAATDTQANGTPRQRYILHYERFG